MGRSQRHRCPPRSRYLQANRLPLEANCIEPWEAKIDAIVKETKGEDMRLISGILVGAELLERLLEFTGAANVKKCSPTWSCCVRRGGIRTLPRAFSQVDWW